MKRLLIVAHAPSPNTLALRNAVEQGAITGGEDAVGVIVIPPLEADAADVLKADGIILGTTENLGYMSGALKDFFDRIYYKVLDEKQGLPMAVYIRAGMDGTGTQRAIESITTGLGWKSIQPPLICRGEWQDNFINECKGLGMLTAAGLDAGVF